MDYKGYHIIAEIDVNYQCDFTLTEHGNIDTLDFLSEGGVDRDNLSGFAIDHEEYGYIEFDAKTVDEAKAAIDKHIERMAKAKKLYHNMPGYTVGEKLVQFATPDELLEIADLNDKKAEIHNRILDRKNRDWKPYGWGAAK